MKFGFVCLLLMISLLGCSGDSDKKNNTDTENEAAKQVAQKIVGTIQKPIDKAQHVKDLGDKHAETLEKYGEESQ